VRTDRASVPGSQERWVRGSTPAHGGTSGGNDRPQFCARALLPRRITIKSPGGIGVEAACASSAE
jgi:hypothetical protein